MRSIIGVITSRTFVWTALVGMMLFPAFLIYDFLSGGRPILGAFARPVYFEDRKTLFRTYGGQVFYLIQGNIHQDWRLLPEADAGDLVLHSAIWASSGDHVYRKNEKTTFSPNGFSVSGCYVSDGESVFYIDGYDIDDRVVVSNDAENFELIPTSSGRLDEHTCQAKDREAVYFWHWKVELADPASFRFLSLRWTVDDERVFVDGNWAEGLSPSGLAPAQGGLVTDGVSMFAPLTEHPYFEVRGSPEALPHDQ